MLLPPSFGLDGNISEWGRLELERNCEIKKACKLEELFIEERIRGCFILKNALANLFMNVDVV